MANVDAFLETIVNEKTQASVEFRLVHPDGSLRHVSATGGAVLDAQENAIGVVGIAFDITQRKQAEENLRALSERLALATRTASIGIWECDLRTHLPPSHAPS